MTQRTAPLRTPPWPHPPWPASPARFAALAAVLTASLAAWCGRGAESEIWVPIGPAPILGGQTSPPEPVTGRIVDIAVDPTDAERWLIACPGGGIWETRNGGGTWTPRTDDQEYFAISAIVFAPSRPATVYAGTGHDRAQTDYGWGILKSTDGGIHWSLIGTNAFAQSHIRGLRVHPADPEVVLASVRWAYGIPYRDGVYKSTDGGRAWSRKLFGNAARLLGHPSDASLAYSAVFDYLNAAKSGVYRSRDGGETWQRTDVPLATPASSFDEVLFALAPSDPDMAYLISTYPREIWRTRNAWADTPLWEQIPSPNADSAGLASVDPNDSSVLYLGGARLHRFDGTAWEDVTRNLHVDQWAMRWVGERLIVGNDGGIWSTTSRGQAWTNHNSNLAITQIYHGSLHPADPNALLQGTQDNGTQLWQGRQAWKFLSGGDGGYVAFSHSRPDTHWVVSSTFQEMYRTLDGGHEFTPVHPADPRGGFPVGGRFMSLAMFELPPVDENTVLAANGNVVLVSTNLWAAARPTWHTNSPPLGESFDFITTLAFAPSAPLGRVYAAATVLGRVHLTTDAGEHWTDLDPAGVLNNDQWYRAISDLAFSPTDASVLYVTIEGLDLPPSQPNLPKFSTGHVFKTANALASPPRWDRIDTGLNVAHHTVLVDPLQPDRLYVGTDRGVFRSADAGAHWEHLGYGNGMPHAVVTHLAGDPTTGRIVAFTFGRGAFALVRHSDRRLSISSDAGGLRIAWPRLAISQAIERSNAVHPPAAWAPWDLVPRVEGKNFVIRTGLESPAQFFRLASP